MIRGIPIGGVDGGDGRVREPLDERLRPGLCLGQLGRKGVLASHRAGYGKAGQLGELQPSLLEPVAQAQGADHVVAVVLLDLIEMVGGRTLTLAELQPLLEGDDARPGIAQVDLAGEPVERPPSS